MLTFFVEHVYMQCIFWCISRFCLSAEQLVALIHYQNFINLTLIFYLTLFHLCMIFPLFSTVYTVYFLPQNHFYMEIYWIFCLFSYPDLLSIQTGKLFLLPWLYPSSPPNGIFYTLSGVISQLLSEVFKPSLCASEQPHGKAINSLQTPGQGDSPSGQD